MSGLGNLNNNKELNNHLKDAIKELNSSKSAEKVNRLETKAQEAQPSHETTLHANKIEDSSIISKMGCIPPDTFKDFFQDKDVAHVKNIVKNMINSPVFDRADLVKDVKEFEEVTDHMSKDELVEVAEFLNDMMRGPDGKNDELLGQLMNSVLDKLKGHGKIRDVFPNFPKEIPLPFPKEPRFPWDEKMPNLLDKGPRPLDKIPHPHPLDKNPGIEKLPYFPGKDTPKMEKLPYFPDKDKFQIELLAKKEEV